MEKKLKAAGMVSKMKGYRGYRHVSCISINDQVVHGVPSKGVVIKDGDLVIFKSLFGKFFGYVNGQPLSLSSPGLECRFRTSIYILL